MKKKLKFVATADWHMWPVLWKGFPQVRGDSERAAAEVAEYAQKHELPLVVAGDIFDYGEQGGVSRELRLFNDIARENRVYYIAGNHEDTGLTAGKENGGWLEPLHGDNLTHLHHQVIDVDGYQFGGLDYQRGSNFTEALEEYKAYLAELGVERLDVLVLHQALGELLGFEGAAQTDCQQLVGIADVVVIGDIHIHRCWEEGGTTFISPGSPVHNNWGEIVFDEGGKSISDSRGFFEVTLGGDEPEAEYRTLTQQRDFYQIKALTPEDEAEALSTLESIEPAEATSLLSSAFIRLQYSAGSHSFLTEVRRIAAEKGATIDLRAVHPSTGVEEGLEPMLLESDTDALRAEVIGRHVDIEEDPKLVSVINEILADPQQRPDVIINRVVDEMLT